MQVYPNQFNQEISRSLKPVYLLFGDEPQQKFEMIEAVRNSARQQGFTERTVFVADKEFSWSALLEATQTLSLFSSQQLIELELPTGKPGTEGSKVLQTIAATLGTDILLIIHGPRIAKDVQKAKWFKVLDEIGVFSLSYALEGKQLYSWVQQQLQLANVSTTPACVKLIADFCEGNMLAAKQEIQKLSLLFDQQHITEDQVEAAMVDQSRYNVFQLIDVMLGGEQQRCIKMLYRLESEGIEPNIIIWALLREWQLLWKLRRMLDEGEAIQWQRHGIWRNKQALYQAALNRLSKNTLTVIRDQLRDADIAFKQQTVVRPYIKICHLCMLFLAIPLQTLPFMD
ncbi:DNA polymerase III subunit delta [Alteromonas pelagimontana]|uniref:DNA polymerase III subunit delta n=1 Tax=Alteromonas pelagimontana TaxID=1858656 RepID=A0A6M4MHJ0_9ALTE|nr:DNA polymerase III subunit delta [Alteromonas pelagimontana]QJR82467.1 DNA polymerase III subunit delta [Alteromonas pelagimontana]